MISRRGERHLQTSYINACRGKKIWTAEEDKKLRHLVESAPSGGTMNWVAIAEMLPERTGKQCRERWHNHLSEGIKKGDWTEEEDQIIISMQKSIGNQWAKITKMLPGRTDNAVKNRFHATERARRNRDGHTADQVSVTTALPLHEVSIQEAQQLDCYYYTEDAYALQPKMLENAGEMVEMLDIPGLCEHSPELSYNPNYGRADQLPMQQQQQQQWVLQQSLGNEVEVSPVFGSAQLAGAQSSPFVSHSYPLDLPPQAVESNLSSIPQQPGVQQAQPGGHAHEHGHMDFGEGPIFSSDSEGEMRRSPTISARRVEDPEFEEDSFEALMELDIISFDEEEEEDDEDDQDGTEFDDSREDKAEKQPCCFSGFDKMQKAGVSWGARVGGNGNGGAEVSQRAANFFCGLDWSSSQQPAPQPHATGGLAHGNNNDINNINNNNYNNNNRSANVGLGGTPSPFAVNAAENNLSHNQQQQWYNYNRAREAVQNARSVPFQSPFRQQQLQQHGGSGSSSTYRTATSFFCSS